MDRLTEAHHGDHRALTWRAGCASLTPLRAAFAESMNQSLDALFQSVLLCYILGRNQEAMRVLTGDLEDLVLPRNLR